MRLHTIRAKLSDVYKRHAFKTAMPSCGFFCNGVAVMLRTHTHTQRENYLRAVLNAAVNKWRPTASVDNAVGGLCVAYTCSNALPSAISIVNINVVDQLAPARPPPPSESCDVML